MNEIPAFPQLTEEWTSGMSLRDYFAGQALASFTGEGGGVAVNNWRRLRGSAVAHAQAELDAARLAEVAYFIADAMLKAREGREP